MSNLKSQKGAVAMISVIVISTVSLSLALTVGLIGISDLQISFDRRLEQRATAAADTCLEEAMYRLKRDSAFTGTSLTMDANTSCTVALSGAGATRTAVSEGAHQNANVTITATLTIATNGSGKGKWVEISNIIRGD